MIQALFDQAPGCMIVFGGPEHVVQMANPAYLAFTGVSDIVGKPVRKALPRGAARGFAQVLDDIYASGAARVLRNTAVPVTRFPGGPTEEAYADFVLQPMRASDGRVCGVFCQGHEVTLEKLAADELRASREELKAALEAANAMMREREAAEEKLRQAQKMEAIGRLTGGIAHDFNNLLTVVIGSAEALVDALPDRPELEEMARLALDAAERGAELVSRLLSFARTQPLTPQPIDCGRFLDEMLPILQRTLSGRIAVAVEVADDDLRCLADPTQLTAAVLNLCINARDAMPDGGRLTLKVTQDVAREADRIVLSVTDDGDGMSPLTLARALEPFFTTKPVGQGSGLGLSMVHGFVAQSGGRMDIESEAGRGTTVRLSLPQAPIEKPAAAPATTPANDMDLPRHVLLVEDDDLLRDQVQRQLVGLGCRVTAQRNAHDALRRLDAEADIDLLMTDIVMPGGMNGRQLGDHARLLHPRLRILFTSGHTDEATVHGLCRGGHANFLAKPYRRGDLARSLHAAFSDQPLAAVT